MSGKCKYFERKIDSQSLEELTKQFVADDDNTRLLAKTQWVKFIHPANFKTQHNAPFH